MSSNEIDNIIFPKGNNNIEWKQNFSIGSLLAPKFKQLMNVNLIYEVLFSLNRLQRFEEAEYPLSRWS